MNVASSCGGAAVVVAAVLVAVLGVPAPSSSQPSDTLVIVKDEAPLSNVDIAVALSQATPLPAPDTVLIGRDDDFADALASGVMQSRSPLLLVPSAGPLPETVVEEVQRLGSTRAVILGGEAAVQPAVDQELQDLGLAVERRAGGSRFETAIDIARNDASEADTVILARAFPAPGATDLTQGFADSIAAGGMSAEFGWPVLLTQTDTLAEPTRAYLAEAGITQVEIMGGTAAISAAVEQQIRDMGITTERLAGNSRAETALAVADKLGAPTAADADHVVLVQGQAPDAWAGGFAAAAHAALLDAPIVLATGDTLPPATLDWLRDGATDPGYAVVPDDGSPVLTCVVVPSLCEEARVTLGLPPDSPTGGPLELLSTDPGGIAAGGYAPSTSADGRTVAFLSDGPLSPDADGALHVWAHTADGLVMVDRTPDGSPAATFDPEAQVSADGRWVVFTSEDQTLSGGDLGQLRSAYVHDLQTGDTAHVSIDGNGDPGNYVGSPSIDADGSVVSYVSQGEVGQDAGCACYWMWWHDLDSGEVGVVQTPDGAPVEAAGGTRPKLSGDGTALVFMTATGLLPGDDNDGADTYLYDITAGALELISVGPDGHAGTTTDSNPSREVGVSHDASVVTFASTAGDLVAGDGAESGQVYLRDRSTGTTVRLTGPDPAGGIYTEATAGLSTNGRWAVFASSNDPTATGRFGCGVFRFSVLDGTITRIDQGPGDSNNCPIRADVADDGTVVTDHFAALHDGNDEHENALGGYDVYRSGPG